MAVRPKRIALDSFALLAYLQDERGYSQVATHMQHAESTRQPLIMSIINLGEVAYTIERKRGLEATQAILAYIKQMPIQVMPVDEPLVLAAAHIKAQHPLAYADAFAIVTAIRHNAILLTGDPEILALSMLIETEYLPR